jgi:hypothetical protein
MKGSRRGFIRKFFLGSVGATACLAAPSSIAAASTRANQDAYDRLSIPDDWSISGYKTCYHGRAVDPKHFVDLISVACRGGTPCSAGFLRRQMIAMAENVDEANEGIAYLNRGIRDRWLMHGPPRSSGVA